MNAPCPLCQCDDTLPYHRDKVRDYRVCERCCLVYVPVHQHISTEDEKAQYDFHENAPENDGYRRFLSRLATPILERLEAPQKGLDFGSGPGPTLSKLFEEAGHSVALFDIFYANDPSVFNETYDFITASEVVEHLSDPDRELERLWSCLRSGGLFGIMTKRVMDKAAFETWHYKNDPTHISFFSEETFRWLGGKWNADPEFISDDVVLFRKPQQ